MRTKDELIKAVEGSYSMAEVVRKLGLNKSKNTYSTLRKELEFYNIETNFRKRSRNTTPYKNREIYCENSTYDRTTLRNRIIKENILNYQCYQCGIVDWNDKSLSLQLDHINGIPNDHRIENLRFLCPNCHSQTKTWGNKK
jgi:5-methylcytosine-specific restriction endonuclease McrA